MAFVQNDVTKKFIGIVKDLINKGTVKDYNALAVSVGWAKASLSNVLNGRINVPQEVLKSFQKVYKIKILSEAEDEIIAELRTNILSIMSHLEVYENAIAGLMTKDKNEFMQKVSLLRKEVQEATMRRFEQLNKL